MKLMKRLYLAAAVCGVAAMSSGNVATPTPGKPLIPDGDFESAPAGWARPNENISYGLENGNHFLRLQATVPGRMVMVYRGIPLPTGARALELSFRTRYEAIKRGDETWHDGRIIANFKDAANQVVPGAPTPYFNGTHAEWRAITNRFIVPAGAKSLEIMPALFQVKSGTLDVDDLRLTVLPASEADAMIAAKDEAARQKAAHDAIVAKEMEGPSLTVPLKVSGNQLVDPDGKPVWLQGLSVDSMQWSMGENVLWSIHVAIDEWHARVIRLAVIDDLWFGRAAHGVGAGQEEAYRQAVDRAVRLCSAKGAYLVIDLHLFRAPTEDVVAFWKDVAPRYKNNPAVFFELFNEPHDITWEVWRNGGEVTDKVKPKADVVVENKEALRSFQAVGMQQLVETIRATGAKNIIIAGGLDWSYDLGGVLNGFALDDKTGDGLMYSTHVYPWKRDWQGKFIAVSEKYPLFMGEVGAIRKWEDFSFIGEKQRYPLEGWAEDILGVIQKYKINWTGFSFNPHCGPMVISDWNYTPTPYWGVYVKDALAGKTFETKKMR